MGSTIGFGLGSPNSWQYSVGEAEESLHAETTSIYSIVQSFRYDIGLWQTDKTDRQTDTRRHHIYRASLASHGKNEYTTNCSSASSRRIDAGRAGGKAYSLCVGMVSVCPHVCPVFLSNVNAVPRVIRRVLARRQQRPASYVAIRGTRIGTWKHDNVLCKRRFVHLLQLHKLVQHSYIMLVQCTFCVT